MFFRIPHIRRTVVKKYDTNKSKFLKIFGKNMENCINTLPKRWLDSEYECHDIYNTSNNDNFFKICSFDDNNITYEDKCNLMTYMMSINDESYLFKYRMNKANKRF